MIEQVYVFKGINPEPWTAPRPGTKGGKVKFMYSDPKLKMFKNALAAECQELYPDAPCIPEGQEFSLCWWFQRDTTEGNQADVTNLIKAAEDALQGVLYANDRGVVSMTGEIIEQGPGVEPLIVVKLVPHRVRIVLPEVVYAIEDERAQRARTHEEIRRMEYEPEEDF